MPEPVTTATRVIHQTRRGVVIGWATVLSVPLLPLALLERVFGADQPLINQAWILSVGAMLWYPAVHARRWMAPANSTATLTVTPDHLTYRATGVEVTISRPDIGLISVIGAPGSGHHVVTVYDYRSQVLAEWLPRWSGRDDDYVVKVLRRAGYPAVTNRLLYDGRFQAQTPGQSPRTAH